MIIFLKLKNQILNNFLVKLILYCSVVFNYCTQSLRIIATPTDPQISKINNVNILGSMIYEDIKNYIIEHITKKIDVSFIQFC